MEFHYEIKRSIKDDPFVLSRIFKCNSCNHNFTYDVKNQYYACSYKKKGKCNQPYIRKDLLIEVYKEIISELERVARNSLILDQLQKEAQSRKIEYERELHEVNKDLEKKALNFKLLSESEIIAMHEHYFENLDNQEQQAKDRMETYSDIDWAIKHLRKLTKEHISNTTIHFNAIYLSDKRIVKIKLHDSVDYLIQRALNGKHYKFPFVIEHNKYLLNYNLNSLSDFMLKNPESSIYHIQMPSEKTRKRWHKKRESESNFKITISQKILNFIFKNILIKLPPFKQEESDLWSAFGASQEREREIAIYSTLVNKKNGNKKFETHAIKPYKDMLIKLNWLVKHKPEHYKLYCDWESDMQHLIGKVFGHRNKEREGFSKLCCASKYIFWNYDKKAKLNIDRFINNKENYRMYINQLILILDKK